MTRGLFIRHNHISRAEGQSLVASVAYRTRTRLQDERQQKIHDYTHKRDLIQAELFAPDSLLERYRDYEGAALYERLSNDYERREDQSTRPRQALLGREFIAMVPRECDHAQGWEIAQGMGESIRRRGLASIIAFHESEASDGPGQKNAHLHILILPRHIEPDGSFGKRYEALDPRGKRSEREVQKFREAYLRTVNDKMKEWGIDVDFVLKKEEEAKTADAAEERSREEETRRMREAQRVRETPEPSSADEKSPAEEDLERFLQNVRRGRSQIDGARRAGRRGKPDPKWVAEGQALRAGAMAARDARARSEGAVAPSRQRSVNATVGVRHGAQLSARLDHGARGL